MLEDVVDLGGAVEGQLRPTFVHGLDDAQRMGGRIEEVGVAVGDVARP